MVFPAQKIVPNVPETTDSISSVDSVSGEGAPQTPEGVSTIGTPQPKPNQDTPQQDNTVNSDSSDPKPGKIVNKASTHKEKITTLQTPDKITLEADREENEFIPLVEEVHDTAHD